MKTKVAGLFLWAVKIEFEGGDDTLWITTAKYVTCQVLAKAERVLKEQSSKYPKGRVVGMSTEGTIDA